MKAKKDNRDKANVWRFGILEVYRPHLDMWVRLSDRINIKPGESVKAICEELKAEFNEVKCRLFVPDF